MYEVSPPARSLLLFSGCTFMNHQRHWNASEVEGERKKKEGLCCWVYSQASSAVCAILWVSGGVCRRVIRIRESPEGLLPSFSPVIFSFSSTPLLVLFFSFKDAQLSQQSQCQRERERENEKKEQNPRRHLFTCSTLLYRCIYLSLSLSYLFRVV